VKTWWKTRPSASLPFADLGLPTAVSESPTLQFEDGYHFANANRQVVGAAYLRQVSF
jgi:hypothetical protein